MSKKKFEVIWEEHHKAIVEMEILKGTTKEEIIDEAERIAIEEVNSEDSYQEIMSIDTFEL